MNLLIRVLRGDTPTTTFVTELDENGNSVTDMSNICNIFNEYFVSIGSTLSSGIPNVPLTTFRDYLPNRNEHSMFLYPTVEDEMY